MKVRAGEAHTAFQPQLFSSGTSPMTNAAEPSSDFSFVQQISLKDNLAYSLEHAGQVTGIGRSAMVSLALSLVQVGGLLFVAPILGFWYRMRQKTVVERQIKNLSEYDQLRHAARLGSNRQRRFIEQHTHATLGRHLVKGAGQPATGRVLHGGDDARIDRKDSSDESIDRRDVR